MEIYSKEINKFENPVVWNLDPSKFKDLLLPTCFNLALVKLTFFSSPKYDCYILRFLCCLFSLNPNKLLLNLNIIFSLNTTLHIVLIVCLRYNYEFFNIQTNSCSGIYHRNL